MQEVVLEAGAELVPAAVPGRCPVCRATGSSHSSRPSQSHSQPITAAVTSEASSRASTISGLPGKAMAVAVRTIGLIAGADSRNAKAAAGVTPRRIRLSRPAPTRTRSRAGRPRRHRRPGRRAPGCGQQPGEHPRRYERVDRRRHDRAEQQEGQRLHGDGEEDGPPGGDGRGVEVSASSGPSTETTVAMAMSAAPPSTAYTERAHDDAVGRRPRSAGILHGRPQPAANRARCPRRGSLARTL